MTVDTTGYYDSLIAASSATATATTGSSTSLSSTDFIALLCTELQYQDPTEPVDNSQMVDQMTQYSQLEQLSEMNDKFDSLSDSMTALAATNALDYLGTEIEAEGYTLCKSGDDVSSLYLTLDDDASDLTLNIYDTSGNIVDTQTFSDVEAGTTLFQWEGTDYDNAECDDGYYYVVATATDADGAEVDCSTTTTGTVTGISNTDDGVILTLSDGRTVNMLDVTYATS